MKNPCPSSARLRRAIALLAIPVFTAPAVLAGAFLYNGAGTYEYTDTNNWGGGVIGNNWTANVTADQTITFNQDYTTVAPSGGSSSLIISSTTSAPGYTQTFRADTGIRTLTLGGSLALTGTGNATTPNTTVFDSSLNISLTATRKFEAYANRILEIQGVISGAGGLTIEQGGTIRFSNTNTFSGGVTFQNGAGVLQVTKLANGGENSSIGKSDNTASRLNFNVGSTLRYVGSGDSTDRRFTMNVGGAKFDASGTGALKWTNTANATLSGATTARTVTFLGTNTSDNTMAAGFVDGATGATSIKKEGTGRWILSGTNTYTGDTTIDAGTLELGSSNSGGNGSNVVLNGGTLATGGFSETFGTLDLNGNATLDLGAVDSDLVFANSSGVAWGTSISLSVVNYTEGVDSLFFGIGGLTNDQLALITVNGMSAMLQDGYLVAAIPEPSTYALLVGAGGLLIAGNRRRPRLL